MPATARAQAVRVFNEQELAEWVQRYATYYQHGYDIPYCQQWAKFHYELYLADGTLPDFMR